MYKKIISLLFCIFLLILFCVETKAEADEAYYPYPIIFIHGINSGYWNAFKIV
jgi:hypothetical protein